MILPLAYIFSALASLTSAAAQVANANAPVAAPSLGKACRFTVLASSSLVAGNTGTYSGDLGISPALIAAVDIPGGLIPVSGKDYYSSKQVVGGFVYPPGVKTDLAHTDFLAAFATAGALAPSVGVNDRSFALGGQTFTPGVYSWTSPVYMAASSTVTLVGEVTDVFVFQINTLTTGAFSTVVLTGGVTPATVFWVLASTMTIGASSQFAGQALAGTAVTIRAGVVWTGAIYSQASVSMGTGVVVDNSYSTCAPAGGPSARAKRSRKTTVLAPRWDRDVVRGY